MTESYRDGNSAAGPLSEVFTADATCAIAECGSCGSSDVLAEARVFDHDEGTVLRCRSCDAVLIRIVEGGSTVRLDVTGLTVISFDVVSR